MGAGPVARERENATQLRRELDQTRRDFEQARRLLEDEVQSARQSAQEATAETAGVRVELATTQADAAAVQRGAEVDREALTSMSHDLERHRDDARAERDALRAAHAEQLAQSQRSADERVQALTEALAVAKEAAETYRAQLTTASTSTAKRPVSANSQPLGCHSKQCDMVDHARHFARVRGAQARPFTRPPAKLPANCWRSDHTRLKRDCDGIGGCNRCWRASSQWPARSSARV